MMQYSKGDTIKLPGDRLALILKDGLSSDKFLVRYNRQWIDEFCHSGCCHRSIQYDSDRSETNVFWYYVLIGDQKGWYIAVQ